MNFAMKKQNEKNKKVKNLELLKEVDWALEALPAILYRRAVKFSWFATLRALSGGKKTMTELAKARGIPACQVTQEIRAMKKRGLVAQERKAADGRLVHVFTLEAGREMLEAITADLSAVPHRHQAAA